MDTALILADKLLAVIRTSGASKMEAHAALSIAGDVLPTIRDVTFRNDLEDDSGSSHPMEATIKKLNENAPDDEVRIGVDEKQLDRCLALMRSLGPPTQTVREKLSEVCDLEKEISEVWGIRALKFDRNPMRATRAGDGRTVCYPSDALLELIRARGAFDLQ